VLIESIHQIIEDKFENIRVFSLDDRGTTWVAVLMGIVLLSDYLPINLELGYANITPHSISLAITGLFFLWWLIVKRGESLDYEFSSGLVVFPIIGLIAYGFCQLPFVESPLRVVVEVVQLSGILLVSIILWGSEWPEITDKDIKNVLRIFYWFSFIGTVNAGIYATLTGNQFVGSASVWFAFGSIAYGFFYAFYKVIFSGNKYYYIPLVVSAWAIVLSEQRGLWLAVFFAIAVVFVIYREIRVKLVTFAVPLLIVLLLVGYFGLIPPGIVDHYDSIISGRIFHDARFYRWATHGQMFLKNPFGVGLGNARYHIRDYVAFDPAKLGASPSVFNSNSPPQGSIIGAHSDWIALLGETGVVGVLLYGTFWFFILRKVIFGGPSNFYSLTLISFLLVLFASSFISLKLLTGSGVTVVLIYYFLKRLG